MRDNWTEEQITIVLYEYCRRPFGQFNGTKQFVIDLGNLIGRSPAAIVRKVGNLASFDTQLKVRGVGGLTHTAKLDAIVWNKYCGHWDKLAYDAEVLIARFRHKDLEASLNLNLVDMPSGGERVIEVKRRINQDFFRRTVLSSYNQKCCITGINNPALLQASHIIDWSIDETNRTNPQNGLCLNVLFHNAYDNNLIGITPDYEIVISKKFFCNKIQDVDESTIRFVMNFDHKRITMPRRFLPDRDLLAQHYEKFQQKEA